MFLLQVLPIQNKHRITAKAGLQLCHVTRMFTILLVGFSKRSFKQEENFLVPPVGQVEDCQLVIPTQIYISWEALPQQCQVCV